MLSTLRDRITIGLLSVAVLTLTSGCYKNVEVATPELPKLSGAFTAAAVNAPDTLAVRVVHVSAPDGRIVEVKGEFDLDLEMEDGTRLSFEHPVVIERSEGNFLIAGANRGQTEVDPSEVHLATVTQPDRLKSALLGAGLGAAPFVVLGVVFFL